MGIGLFIIRNDDRLMVGILKLASLYLQIDTDNSPGVLIRVYSQITWFGCCNNSLDVCLCTLESMVPERADYLSRETL